jgi:hypothetical protein
MTINPNATAAGSTPSIDDIMKMANPGGTGSAIRGMFGSILGGLGNFAFPGLGGAIGSAISGAALGGALPTLGGQTTQFLQLQQKIEQESLAFETASTVLKVRHDCALDAVKNMAT